MPILRNNGQYPTYSSFRVTYHKLGITNTGPFAYTIVENTSFMSQLRVLLDDIRFWRRHLTLVNPRQYTKRDCDDRMELLYAAVEDLFEQEGAYHF